MKSVREITETDIHFIIDYFLQSSPEFLNGIGVDINKLPEKNEWTKIIADDFNQPAESKILLYYLANRQHTCRTFKYQ